MALYIEWRKFERSTTMGWSITTFQLSSSLFDCKLECFELQHIKSLIDEENMTPLFEEGIVLHDYTRGVSVKLNFHCSIIGNYRVVISKHLIKVVQGLVKIGQHSSWRFVGDLYWGLQNPLWYDVVFGRTCRLSWHVHTIVVVATLTVSFKSFLQSW